MKISLKISERVTGYAVSALLSICSVSEKSWREVVTAGFLMLLLLLVQSDQTKREKRKAQMLLKLPRDCWPVDLI